jgi:hypothetical protein
MPGFDCNSKTQLLRTNLISNRIKRFPFFPLTIFWPCQECDEVIHLIPEKTVHQRTLLTQPGNDISAASVQTIPHYAIAHSVQSSRFQSQLDATIHEQRLSHMQMQASRVKMQPSAGESAPERSGSFSTSEPVSEDFFEEYYDEVQCPHRPHTIVRSSPCHRTLESNLLRALRHQLRVPHTASPLPPTS